MLKQIGIIETEILAGCVAVRKQVTEGWKLVRHRMNDGGWIGVLLQGMR